MIASGRKFLRAFAAAVVAVAVLLAAVTEIFDPYSENGWAYPGQPRFAYRILSARPLFAQLDDGPHNVVFGTSRSAMLTEAATGAPTLNFYMIYGNPMAVLGLLRRLDERQWANIREAFYLLDAHVFCPGCWMEDVDYTDPAEILLYKARHFPETVRRLPLDITRVLKGSPDAYGERGALVGWNPSAYDGSWVARASEGYSIWPYDEHILALLPEIDRLMRAHGKSIHYFTPTLPDITLAKTDRARLADLKRAILRHLPAYHDLTRLDGLSERPELFADETHVNMFGAQGVICAIRSGRFVITRAQAETIDPALGHPADRPPLPHACIARMGPAPAASFNRTAGKIFPAPIQENLIGPDRRSLR